MGADAKPPFVRTTVLLREDLYQRLKRQGPISDALNKILAREFRRDHRMFGSSPRLSRDDLRDHEDHV
ncbi:MAG TPA: hypothetical protein VI997_09455 [Candidatus Thermoplasmatota archaeon]|nr:hypothetical protein [Candidatus Thermoplasmatota archaeon]